ncbi:MAG: hypothetical protein QXL94_00170 [Candidatus Parvarchaeum sp.]
MSTTRKELKDSLKKELLNLIQALDGMIYEKEKLERKIKYIKNKKDEIDYIIFKCKSSERS